MPFPEDPDPFLITGPFRVCWCQDPSARYARSGWQHFLFSDKIKTPSENRRRIYSQDYQMARSTLLERRHLVHAYTWQGVPLTTALTRLTLGFHARLERLWEWETLIPKVTPLPQKSHLAISCTSHPDVYSTNYAYSQALRYDNKLSPKMQAFFSKFFCFLKIYWYSVSGRV